MTVWLFFFNQVVLLVTVDLVVVGISLDALFVVVLAVVWRTFDSSTLFCYHRCVYCTHRVCIFQHRVNTLFSVGRFPLVKNPVQHTAVVAIVQDFRTTRER